MLDKKKILVVGAGGLLGSHTVGELLNHNATVVATDVHYEKMLHRLIQNGIEIDNHLLSCMPLDITNQQQVSTFFAETQALDGVVNCAYPRNKNYGNHFLDVSLQDFNENLSLHLGSTFLLTQQCAKFFLRVKKSFSLVNIASIYGVIPPKFDIYTDTTMTMPVEYAAIKSAILHLNKYATNYIRNSDFRINSVSPGGILDDQPEIFLNEYRKQTLGKGMLKVQDVLGAILFLLSDYSRYMNGQNLIVDDGFSL